MSANIQDVVLAACRLVLSRVGDIDTEDGTYAAVDADDVINLESKIVQAFNLKYDDLNKEDLITIIQKTNHLK